MGTSSTHSHCANDLVIMPGQGQTVCAHCLSPHDMSVCEQGPVYRAWDCGKDFSDK
ncbi:UNVERIFIED_CONTAM: hypothetical protein K2H54_057615, partial [Gekko kuhli]